MTILSDEYLFGTYFAVLCQGIPLATFDGFHAFNKIVKQVLDLDMTHFANEEVQINDHEKMMKIASSLRNQFTEQVTSTYVKDFLNAVIIHRKLVERSADRGTQTLKLFSDLVAALSKKFDFEKGHMVSSVQQNLTYLDQIMGLGLSGKRMLELAFLFSTDIRAAIFRDLLAGHVKNVQVTDHFFKTMLNDPENPKLGEEAFSDHSLPMILGIVTYDQKAKRLSSLSEFWVYAIGNPAESQQQFNERFLVEVKDRKKSFSGAIATLKNVNTGDLLNQFLNHAVVAKQVAIDTDAPTKEKEKEVDDFYHGLNALVYGSARLDKLGFISDRLKENKILAYEVASKNSKSMDVPAITYVAQRLLDQRETYRPKGEAAEPRVALIVNQAESALTKNHGRPSWFLETFGSSVSEDDGEELLQCDELLLTKNPVPTIWLSNSARSISAENVGRFLIHCELSGGSRKERSVEVEKVIAELGYPPELVAKLSQYFELNVEQIRSAGKLLQLVEIVAPENAKQLLNLVENSQKALDRDKREELRESVTKYSLDYLNIASKMPLDKMIAALKRTRQGTLCFFGLPGTGKTQLVDHIARELDMPLVTKSASELLSKYLGESEKLIAEAFEEARAENAILFIDEGDSFLQDRTMAEHSWEVTQVNELLQRMERFQGIFIMATNLMQKIDSAALRRFTFKLQFLALTPDQRMLMLRNEVGAEIDLLTPENLEVLKDRLTLILHLTPGDFTVVKRQATIMDEKLNMEDWLIRLAAESEAKLEGIMRNDGYQREQRVINKR